MIAFFMKKRHSAFSKPNIRQSCFSFNYLLLDLDNRHFIVFTYMNLWEEFLSKTVGDNAKKETNLVLLGMVYMFFVIWLGKSRQDCIGVMECIFSSVSHKELKSYDSDVIHYSFIAISTSSRTNGKAGRFWFVHFLF